LSAFELAELVVQYHSDVVIPLVIVVRCCNWV